MKQITRKRQAIRKEHGLPEFLEGEYAEAEAYAEKSLESLRAGEIRNAKALYWAANAYYEGAERDVRDKRELSEKITELLGPKQRKRRAGADKHHR